MFAKRLRELRKEFGLTQRELGEKVGVSQRVLGYYETENRFPDEHILNKLADVFNVSVDYLLGRTLVKENIDTVGAHRKNPHEELPEEAQEQLNDYIEFLLNKYKKK